MQPSVNLREHGSAIIVLKSTVTPWLEEVVGTLQCVGNSIHVVRQTDHHLRILPNMTVALTYLGVAHGTETAQEAQDGPEATGGPAEATDRRRRPQEQG